VDYLKSDKEPSSKQITTGFTTVTCANLDKPEVRKYLYKAECQGLKIGERGRITMSKGWRTRGSPYA